MGTIREDITKSAEWIATALSSSGYTADFSPKSFWELDRFFEEHSDNCNPKPVGLLAAERGSRLFAVGCYIGEVLRRNVGGEWHVNDNDPHAEINIELKLADDSVCWPVQRAMKRLKNGREDGIAAYGSALGLPVGAQPPATRKGFFIRLFGN